MYKVRHVKAFIRLMIIFSTFEHLFKKKKNLNLKYLYIFCFQYYIYEYI